MIWALLVLVVVFAVPFVVERRRTVMSDGRRGAAPGQFVELSQGVTHFQLGGPPDGPLIICVHGLTTPSFVWTGLAKGLAAKGFRVLTYDLLGRGFSDRPGGLQDKEFFLTQLDDLLDHIEVDETFHLIGYSMGGAIAAAFAAGNPDRVERLVLLAPAGMVLRNTRALRFARERGLLGTWAMLVTFPRRLRTSIRAAHEDHTSVPNIAELMARELTFQGYVPAVLSSLRGVLAHPMESAHLSIRRAGIPTLAIWGEDDDVVPASAMGQLAAWNRDVRHEVVEGAAHGLPHTHTKAVLAHLERFLPPPQAPTLAAPSPA